MINTTFKRISKVTMVAFAFGLIVLGGCAGQGDSQGANDVSVKVFSGLKGSCLNAVRALPGQNTGGLRRPTLGQNTGGLEITTSSSAVSCNAFTIDISGSAPGADSVLINVNGQDISVTVNVDGTYHAQIPVDVAPETVTITPFTGEIVGVSQVLSPSLV